MGSCLRTHWEDKGVAGFDQHGENVYRIAVQGGGQLQSDDLLKDNSGSEMEDALEIRENEAWVQAVSRQVFYFHIKHIIFCFLSYIGHGIES